MGRSQDELVSLTAPDSARAEAYRQLLAALRAGPTPAPSLLVTAADAPGQPELVAANLAVAAARSGLATVLIAAGELPAALAPAPSAEVAAAPVPSTVERLALVPTAAFRAAAGEPPVPERLPELLAQWSAGASWWVLAAPPLPAAAAVACAPFAARVLLSVRARRTPRAAVVRAQQELARVGAPAPVAALLRG